MAFAIIIVKYVLVSLFTLFRPRHSRIGSFSSAPTPPPSFPSIKYGGTIVNHSDRFIFKKYSGSDRVILLWIGQFYFHKILWIGSIYRDWDEFPRLGIHNCIIIKCTTHYTPLPLESLTVFSLSVDLLPSADWPGLLFVLLLSTLECCQS